MKAYFFSVLAVCLSATLLGILSPDGKGGGLARHFRLLAALVLLAVLASPLPALLQKAQAGLLLSVEKIRDAEEGDARAEWEKTMENTSKDYFVSSLTSLLETRFSIPTGEVRVGVEWSDGDEVLPLRVTAVLSGNAIWKDPREIETFVTDLLGCPCETAIERRARGAEE